MTVTAMVACVVGTISKVAEIVCGSIQQTKKQIAKAAVILLDDVIKSMMATCITMLQVLMESLSKQCSFIAQ